MTQELLKVSDVAALLGAGKSTIWRWAQNGDIPAPVKIGGATRWKLCDLAAFIEGVAA